MLTTIERFHSRYVADPLSGCWVWKRPRKGDGYATFDLNRKSCLAHRAAWILLRGQIEGDLCVLHKCDNRACVNPEHLYLGTYKDNRRDFMQRHPKAQVLLMHAHKGLKTYWATMTPEQRSERMRKVRNTSK